MFGIRHSFFLILHNAWIGDIESIIVLALFAFWFVTACGGLVIAYSGLRLCRMALKELHECYPELSKRYR